MSEEKIYPAPAESAARAWADADTYESMYSASVEDPEAFWAEHARKLDWLKPFDEVKDTSF